MPRRYILTGAPGAGKTTTGRRLAAATGRLLVPEAATDLITAAQAAGEPRPWQRPQFCEDVAALQQARARDADTRPGDVQYFDRSPVCTLALARYLGHETGPALAAALADLDRFAPVVLFFDLLASITPTAARRITLDEAKDFERFHLDAYAEHGFRIERLPPLPEADRAALAERLTS